MKRDLFVSSFALALGSGRALRTYTTVLALAELGPLDVAYVPLGGVEPSPEFRAIENAEFHEILPSRGLRRAATYAGVRARGVPGIYARGCSPELAREAERLALAPGRGRIIAGDLSSTGVLMPLARTRGVIYNAHNVESSYRHADHGQRLWTWLAIRANERRILRRVQESWMVSRADMQRAQELVPGARLRYVPNVVDVAAITPASTRDRDSAGPPTVLMVADYTYPPNASGLSMLALDVMPRVWATHPEARLVLVGRGADPDAVSDPRIDALGFVDDLATAYAAADVVAVPLTEGGGTPLKFVEALAYGKAIVATPLAGMGLDVQPGEHFASGGDASSFAAELIGLLGDPERAARMGTSARALAEREYSVQTVTRLISA